jgi:plasmid maintenance system antidote protein VapI
MTKRRKKGAPRVTLRQYLRDHDIKLIDVAQALGMTHWAVIKKLNRERRWTVDEVIKLSAFLAAQKHPVTTDDLVVMCSGTGGEED